MFYVDCRVLPEYDINKVLRRRQDDLRRESKPQDGHEDDDRHRATRQRRAAHGPIDAPVVTSLLRSAEGVRRQPQGAADGHRRRHRRRPPAARGRPRRRLGADGRARAPARTSTASSPTSWATPRSWPTFTQEWWTAGCAQNPDFARSRRASPLELPRCRGSCRPWKGTVHSRCGGRSRWPGVPRHAGDHGPLVRGMAVNIPGDLGDPLLNVWTLWWDLSRLDRRSSSRVLLDANIMYPLPGSLAMSEHSPGGARPAGPGCLFTANQM